MYIHSSFFFINNVSLEERRRDFTSKVLLLELQRDYFFGLMQHFLTYLFFQSKKNATATATAAAAASASSTPNSTEFNVSTYTYN